MDVHEWSHTHHLYTYIIYSYVNIRNRFVFTRNYHIVGFQNIQGQLVSTKPILYFCKVFIYPRTYNDQK